METQNYTVVKPAPDTGIGRNNWRQEHRRYKQERLYIVCTVCKTACKLACHIDEAGWSVEPGLWVGNTTQLHQWFQSHKDHEPLFRLKRRVDEEDIWVAV